MVTAYFMVLVYGAFFSDEIPLAQSNLIATAKIMHKEYSVSFELKPIAFYPTSVPTSVIHFTIGNDNLNYGDRNPAVWVAGNKLWFYSSIGGYSLFYAFKPNFILTLNQWTVIKVSQKFLTQATYQFDVIINGIVFYTITNKDARDFSNILVYAGDPWFPIHSGIIRNLNVTGSDIVYVPTIDTFSFYKDIKNNVTMSLSDVVRIPARDIIQGNPLVIFNDPLVEESNDADACIFKCLQIAKCYSISFSRIGKVCILYDTNIRTDEKNLRENADWDVYGL